MEIDLKFNLILQCSWGFFQIFHAKTWGCFLRSRKLGKLNTSKTRSYRIKSKIWSFLGKFNFHPQNISLFYGN